MGGNKIFSDFLTVLLILVIIGVVGLLGYFGYKAVAKHNVETEAAKAVKEFHRVVERNNSKKDDDNNQVQNEERPDLSEFVNQTQPQTPTENQAPQGSAKTYLSGYEVIGTIRIPKISIEYPILGKASIGALAKSVGVMEIATCDTITSVVHNLNVPGTNAYILGHNYRNGQFFSNNDRLSIGDEIYITDANGETITYTIYKKYYTTPEDVSFMERDLDPNVREITLQTCNSDSSQRLIIWAKDS